MKYCPKCKKTKDKSLFRKDGGRKDGRGSMCLDCKNAVEALWRDENRDKIRKQHREYYRKNSERINKRRKELYDPFKNRAHWMARKIKARECIFCKKQGERHHEDYSKPLEVVFLCRQHHKMVHKGGIKL